MFKVDIYLFIIMLFYLAVDGLLDGGEHRLPLLIYYALDHPFMVGEIQHIVGDKLSSCTLFTSFLLILMQRFLSQVMLTRVPVTLPSTEASLKDVLQLL